MVINDWRSLKPGDQLKWKHSNGITLVGSFVERCNVYVESEGHLTHGVCVDHRLGSGIVKIAIPMRLVSRISPLESLASAAE